MNPHFDWLKTTFESPVFMVLLLCSVVVLGVALERTLYYWKRRGNPDIMLPQVLEKLRAGNTQQATWLCQNTIHPVGRTSLQVLQSNGASDEAVEEKLLVTLSQEKLLLERNIGLLGTMAVTAPLIGLLGTVWGIMRAFKDMSLAGSAAPTVVAGGVAEALITTAAGLAVAIPASFLYNYFSRQMSVMLTVAENHARTIRAEMVDGSAVRREKTFTTNSAARAA
jgi:biopolymer transport protein ExbB